VGEGLGPAARHGQRRHGGSCRRWWNAWVCPVWLIHPFRVIRRSRSGRTVGVTSGSPCGCGASISRGAGAPNARGPERRCLT
jgi:hypothetical protein